MKSILIPIIIFIFTLNCSNIEERKQFVLRNAEQRFKQSGFNLLSKSREGFHCTYFIIERLDKTYEACLVAWEISRGVEGIEVRQIRRIDQVTVKVY